jgi:hypothetical protein
MTPEEKAERLAELKERRRRARWGAFLKPFITLASIVISVSLLMYMIKSCGERYPQSQGRPRLPIQRMPDPPAPAK